MESIATNKSALTSSSRLGTPKKSYEFCRNMDIPAALN
ncbi:MAG: hypothetical protein RLZZ436_1176 [Planctomycetota bacterium]